MGRKRKNVFPNDKATQEWLDSQKTSTRKAYGSHWKYFLEYAGLTGDQILESKKADKDYSWEKKVLGFKNWLIEKDKSERTGTSASIAVRGFFAYHRQDLKFRRAESVKLSEAAPKFEDYRFTKEDLKKMCDFANLKEKYVIVAGKSFGLRVGDFLAIKKGQLEPYLNLEPPAFIGEFTTHKEKVKAFPFIDSDAQPVIKLMIDDMNRQGKTDPNERVLKFKNEIQLSRILKRIADRAGINYGSKRVRFHCLRKFLIDRLSSVMSESKWKQIIGKKISEGAYVSPDSLREDYARAVPETTFTKVVEGDIEKIARLAALKQIVKSMGYTDEDLQTITTSASAGSRGRKTFGPRIPLPIDKQIEVLEEVTKRGKSQTNGGVDIAEYKQIQESDLLAYLKAGWQIVHRLTNGEVIVKR